MSGLRFIDLFAGLGGFHQALAGLGHTCVFASELDPELGTLYEKNFGIRPHGDIRSSHGQIPPHDILCAGFPCQPFSKAGDQLGFDCPQWGDLFDYVIATLERHQPRYLIIENVPNLLRHDEGRTWGRVEERLRSAGYDVNAAKLSPHMFGVPQLRERAIVVGSRTGLAAFQWPSATHRPEDTSIRTVLDNRPADARHLPPAFVGYITTWQGLLDALPKNIDLPSFPIWAMEFGATYPLATVEDALPTIDAIQASRGAFGVPLTGLNETDLKAALPAYSRAALDHPFPKWKHDFILQNRAFYETYRSAIDPWLPSIRSFAPSFQKLEWNWKGGPRNLWNTLLQFRASGIRAKRPSFSPSLVALTTSQVPVIPWERRYMTTRECARLQSMADAILLPSSKTAAHRALGNAVNVMVVSMVARALTSTARSASDSRKPAPRITQMNRLRLSSEITAS